MNAKKFLFFTVCLCTSMLMQARVKLSFNPAEGETYLYRSNTTQSFKQKLMDGRKIANNSVTKTLIEMNIKEKSQDEISLDFVYKEVVWDTSWDTSDSTTYIKYDSKDTVVGSSGPEKLTAQFFNCLIGKTMNVILAPDGSVKSISGFDAVLEDLRKNMTPAELDGSQTKVFLQLYDENAMKLMFEQLFKIYPEKEVTIGDSWNQDIPFTASGVTDTINYTYTFKSLENDIASLDVVSVVNAKSGVNTEGGVVAFSSGESKGEMNINVKTGIPVNITMKGKFEGSTGMNSVSNTTSQTTMTLQQ